MSLPIIEDETYVERCCKRGMGAECCRYLALGRQGWACLKHTTFKAGLDARVAADTILAQGDNCDGLKNPRI